MVELAAHIRQIIVDHFARLNHVDVRLVDHSRLVPDARLVDDLGADSLDIVEIVLTLEDEFGREIAEEEVAKLETVGDVIALVRGDGPES